MHPAHKAARASNVAKHYGNSGKKASRTAKAGQKAFDGYELSGNEPAMAHFPLTARPRESPS
jgi:hypothetical protein